MKEVLSDKKILQVYPILGTADSINRSVARFLNLGLCRPGRYVAIVSNAEGPINKPHKLCTCTEGLVFGIKIKAYLKVSSPALPRMVVAVDVDVIECREARFLGDLLLNVGERELGNV